MKNKKQTLEINKLFTKSFEIYKKNWKQFILIGIILFAVGLIGGFGNKIDLETGNIMRTGFGFFMSTLSWIAYTYIVIGVIRYTLNLVDGKKPKLDSIFYGVDSVKHFLFFVLVTVVTQILIAFGIILFIIPGIIIGLGLMFTKYYIAENRGGVFDTIKTSWKMTKGYKWNLFGLSVFIFLFNILGALVFLVGLIITIPVSSLVMASAYRKIEGTYTPEINISSEE